MTKCELTMEVECQNKSCWTAYLPTNQLHHSVIITRKLSYHKDDRAMHHIYGCCENFRESLSMLWATFPEIFNGLLFRSILWMCVQNLKLVALSVPGIIGDT